MIRTLLLLKKLPRGKNMSTNIIKFLKSEGEQKRHQLETYFHSNSFVWAKTSSDDEVYYLVETLGKELGTLPAGELVEIKAKSLLEDAQLLKFFNIEPDREEIQETLSFVQKYKNYFYAGAVALVVLGLFLV